jgi:glycerol kinase
MSSYILAIDQGTTSSRAVIYDEKFDVQSSSQHEFPQHFPKPDWVEHDLEEIWDSVRKAVEGAISQLSHKNSSFKAQQIVGIGITNQRETFGLWDRKTSRPVHRAIVWQCRRSAEICKKLRATTQGRSVARAAGLVLDPYFSGTKLRWLMESDKSFVNRSAKGELAFGTIDTFLIWKLTGGKSHCTDVTNASRTLLFDISKKKWNPAALKLLKASSKILPEVLPSDGDFGSTVDLGFLPAGIPIRGAIGDQQAALLGQGCVYPGQAKITYGTGSFLVFNSGLKLRRSKNALSTIAWGLKGKTYYALEGSVFVAGAFVQWLRDQLKMIESSKEIEALARQVESSEGCFVIPALTGLGSPYWKPHARGIIGGLTRKTNRAHIARAALEGIALSIADVTEAMKKDLGAPLKSIHVDGGAAANDLLMQYQTDLLGIPVLRPIDRETTVRGAAFAAAIGLGRIQNLSDLSEKNSTEKTFTTKMKSATRKEHLDLWRARIKALFL